MRHSPAHRLTRAAVGRCRFPRSAASICFRRRRCCCARHRRLCCRLKAGAAGRCGCALRRPLAARHCGCWHCGCGCWRYRCARGAAAAAVGQVEAGGARAAGGGCGEGPSRRTGRAAGWTKTPAPAQGVCKRREKKNQTKEKKFMPPRSTQTKDKLQTKVKSIKLSLF